MNLIEPRFMLKFIRNFAGLETKKMKTFLLDSINKYQRFSEELDAKTIICNRSWVVFNDDGIKEVYIFQEDGSIIISHNGIVREGSWKYLSANKSFLISAGDTKFMLHPAFLEGIVMGMNLDGTNQYTFMIDENKAKGFMLKTYQQLLTYLEEEEQKNNREKLQSLSVQHQPCKNSQKRSQKKVLIHQQ